MTTTTRLSEDEANALGFSVDRHESKWWHVCSQADRPFVCVTYRRKYASLQGDEITARPPDRWHEHQKGLMRLAWLAAGRAIEAGYRGNIYYGHSFITTCLADDAVRLAVVLVEVWDGDITGLERLQGEWGGNA